MLSSRFGPCTIKSEPIVVATTSTVTDAEQFSVVSATASTQAP